MAKVNVHIPTVAAALRLHPCAGPCSPHRSPALRAPIKLFEATVAPLHWASVTLAHKAITVIGRIGMKVAAHQFLVVQVCEIMYMKFCHIMHHKLPIKAEAACLQQEPTRTRLIVLLHLIACPVRKGTTVQMMGRPTQSSVCACTCPMYTCTPSTAGIAPLQ